jgi:DNA-binding response OmpR family regulator
VNAPHILVVDDNDLQRGVVADALESEGFDVAVAATGAEALSAARARPPDLVVLDLLLPDVDGASLLAQMRADPALANVRVVVATGVHSPDVRRLLRADGALFKPFGMRELLLAIREALAGGAARA